MSRELVLQEQSPQTIAVLAKIESFVEALYKLFSARQKSYVPSETDQTFTQYAKNGLFESNANILIVRGFAACCVLSYFLQDGAFHKGNIIITADGSVVHKKDFRWCMYEIISKPAYRGSRKISVLEQKHVFSITTRNLNIFPELTADTNLPFWPTVAKFLLETDPDYSDQYQIEEAALFSRLANNSPWHTLPVDTLRHYCYLEFLRILITPAVSVMSVMYEELQDMELYESFTRIIFERKGDVSKKIIEAVNFRKWWENICERDVKFVFDEIMTNYSDKTRVDYIDLAQVRTAYYRICSDIACEEYKTVFLEITGLARATVKDAGECVQQAIGIYEVILALRDVILAMGENFFASLEPTEESFLDFISRLSSVVAAVQSMLIPKEYEYTTHINAVVAQFKKIISYLKKYSYAPSDIGIHEATALLVCEKEDEFFIVHPHLYFKTPDKRPDYLARDAFLWMMKTRLTEQDDEKDDAENKAIIIKIMQKIIDGLTTTQIMKHAAGQVVETVGVQMKNAAEATVHSARQVITAARSGELLTQASGFVSGMWGSAGSFFRATAESARSSGRLMDMPSVESLGNFRRQMLKEALEKIVSDMRDVQKVEDIIPLVDTFLALDLPGAPQAQAQFLEEIIKQHLREAYTKKMICGFQYDVFDEAGKDVFKETFRQMMIDPVSSVIVNEAVALMQRGSNVKATLSELDRMIEEKEIASAIEREDDVCTLSF